MSSPRIERPLHHAAALALFVAAACASDPGPAPGPSGLDAAVADATVADAAVADAAVADAAVADAAGPARDAGPGTLPDAGPGRATVVFEVTVPADTPAGEAVHIAGNFQGWSPSDPAYALTDRGGSVHTITLSFDVGQQLEFKFARGDWARVEKGPGGGELSNRTLTVAESGTQRYTVARWADGAPNPGTRTGDVTELSVPGFLGGRRVWLYLPPGYATDTSTRYPVLYMLDGQNVFDAATSFSGEWEVDEALEALIPAREVAPLIVVAVDNGGGARLDEYTPWVDSTPSQRGGGGGEAHLQAMIGVLKPWVDAHYRTRTGPEDTGFAGSSLGGLMAVYTAYTHGDVFGRIAGLSPSIWWDDDHLLAFVRAGAKLPVRLWVDTGTAEGDLPTFEALVAALVADGFVEGGDLRSYQDVGAGHNEAAWASRMPDILRFLFPAP